MPDTDEAPTLVVLTISSPDGETYDRLELTAVDLGDPRWIERPRTPGYPEATHWRIC